MVAGTIFMCSGIVFRDIPIRADRSMGSEITTSSITIHALLDLLGDRGVTAEEICGKTGIACSVMGDPEIRIPMGHLIALWELAISVTGDPALALRLRSRYGRSMMHFVITIAKNSANLLEAASHWCRYAEVISESDRVELREEGETVILTHTNLSPEYQNIWMTEHDLSSAVKYARRFTEKRFDPVEVRFRHTDPGYGEEYRRVFGSPVRFGEAENAVVLRRKDMERTILSRDPHLQAILKKHAESSRRELSERSSLGRRIEGFITRHLPEGGVDIEMVSAAMNMARSTLHRKLKEEGTTFTALLERTRKELALTYLRQGMSGMQISYLLGFADPSSFQHAFKRWTGKNPGDFRKNRLP